MSTFPKIPSRKSPQWRLRVSRAALSALAGGWLALSPPAAAEDYKSALPVEQIMIETAGGKVPFEVELAVKPVDQQVGLMFRKSMDKKHGMLFEMGTEPREVTFWMKNTLIPLDMLFVADDGTIANIHHNAKPEDLTQIHSNADVTGVIEINGGLADELGIKIGDKVDAAFFKSTGSGKAHGADSAP